MKRSDLNNVECGLCRLVSRLLFCVVDSSRAALMQALAGQQSVSQSLVPDFDGPIQRRWSNGGPGDHADLTIAFFRMSQGGTNGAHYQR